MKKFVAIAAAAAFGLAPVAYGQGTMHGERSQMPQSMSGADSQRMMPMGNMNMGNMNMGNMNMGDAAAAQTHSAAGKVLSVKATAEKPSITIAHGPVSTLQWPAMTMTFRVASPEMLTGVREGDAVAVRFVKGDAGGWLITQLEKTGS
jgi:Cu/Ag efflux protein CusF